MNTDTRRQNQKDETYSTRISCWLYPALPDGRIPAPVKHCEDDQRVRTNAEVHAEGKATRNGTPNIAKYNRIALGSSCGLCDGLFDFVDELLAKARILLVVPDGRILKLPFRSTPEYDAKRHRAKRALTDAFTSSQGTTSSGKESSSATRRSSSARCSSVRGNALASAHMVAQISSTSASRSSTLSRSMPRLLTVAPMVTSAQSVNLTCNRAGSGSSRAISPSPLDRVYCYQS